LLRADAVRRSHVFRSVYVPDRLLLYELALHGQFREVPELLWWRRRTGDASPERQRQAFFPDRRVPLRFKVPWPWSHSAILLWSLAVRGNARSTVTRIQGLAVARRYLHLARARESRRRTAQDQGSAKIRDGPPLPA
jgi:hypothetical protein